MNLEYISVSRKQVWDECQKKYVYIYHDKLTRSSPPYFAYGKIIHAIAEHYVAANGEKTIGQISQDVLNRKIPIEEDKFGKPVFAELPPEYKNKLPEHLRSIQKLTEQIGMGGHLEYEFKHDLDPPNGKFIFGFIDRLINKGDKWFIVDYKTTKRGFWRKNRSNIAKDLQLRSYARVVQNEFNVPVENIHAALLYLDGDELVSTKFSQAHLDSVHEELLEAWDQINNTQPDKVWGNVGDHCRRCDFVKICPFYRIH